MKSYFFLQITLILLSLHLSFQINEQKNENEFEIDIKNETDEELNKTQNPEADIPPERMIRLDYNYKDIKSQTIELGNSNFDSIINGGINNRWVIVFFSSASGFSRNVKGLIDKIILDNNFTHINNIKFGSVDVDYNLILQVRFYVKGVPYIIVVENNTMFEFHNWPTEENLRQFIQIENTTNINIKEFPKRANIFKLIKDIYAFSFDNLNHYFNKFIHKHGIRINVSLKQFLIIFSIAILIIIYIIIKILDCILGTEIPKANDPNKKEGDKLNPAEKNEPTNEEKEKKKQEEEKENEKNNNNNEKNENVIKKDKKEKEKQE